MPLKFISEEERWVTHDLYEPFLVPGPSIVSTLLSVVEILERGETSDFVLFTDRLEFGAIESSQNSLFVFFEVFGCSLVLWLCCLAMATPRGVEHHQNVTLLLQEWLELFISEVVDLKRGRGGGGGKENVSLDIYRSFTFYLYRLMIHCFYLYYMLYSGTEEFWIRISSVVTGVCGRN